MLPKPTITMRPGNAMYFFAGIKQSSKECARNRQDNRGDRPPVAIDKQRLFDAQKEKRRARILPRAASKTKRRNSGRDLQMPTEHEEAEHGRTEDRHARRPRQAR